MKTEFSKYLSNFMVDKGYKLEYISQATGVSVSAIGHYKTGERIPKDDFIEKFISAFISDVKEAEKVRCLILRDRTPKAIIDRINLLENRLKSSKETNTPSPHVPGNAKRIKTVKIPMYGTASAGPGYYNLSIEVEDFLIPEEDFRPGRFAVKVEGESMTGPGKSIPCGSIALVDPNMCTDVEELINKVCVFTYNDETYIKQLIIDKQNLVHLVSFNPEISDIIVLNHKDLKCEGRVVKTYFEQKW